jgi:S-adenosylmethionine uptake transporter
MLLLATPAAWHWRTVPTTDLGLILLAGGLGTLGLLGITHAFTTLEASRVAPLDYTGFVWATLLGYALIGEVPTIAIGASALLIIGGCLLLLRR